MPPATRDRLARPVDISTLYRGASRRVGLIVDTPGLLWAGLNGPRNGRQLSRATTAHGRGRYSILWDIASNDQENRPPGTVSRGGTRGRRGRGGGGLPSWYPRTPLRDITAVVRAIERRRDELNQPAEAPENEALDNEANAAVAATATEVEQENEPQTPLPTVSVKPIPSPATQVVQIKPKNGDSNDTGLDFLTPQKRLLNSIEKVREVWLKERRKLERTPAAKRAERAKKVKTLMTMR